MGFDFGALIAGASEGAATAIDKRNKEIRQSALRDFETLQKTAGEQDEKLRTKRDELKATALALSGFSNSKGSTFTPTQIVGLLQNPIVAKDVIASLKEKKDLELVDFSTVFKIAKDTPELKREAIDKYIAETTSVAIPTAEAPQKVVRGAFGFESPAYAQAQNEFTTATGADLKELRAKAALRGEMPEYTGQKVEGTANLAQFKSPDTVANITAQLRDHMVSGGNAKEGKGKVLMDKLQANAAIEAVFEKGSGEENKPRSADQINKVFQRSLDATTFLYKNVVRFDPQLNDYVPIVGAGTAYKDFVDHKHAQYKKTAEELGILKPDGTIVGGRNSMDALTPYANIKDGKVISFKTVQLSKEDTEGIPAPKLPVAPSPASDQTRSVVMIPPKDQKKPRPVPAGVDPKLWAVMPESDKDKWKQ
jgi:hypothetical protein